MHYVIYNIDRPGSADLRAQARPDHIDFMKSLGEKVKVGGPLLGPDGETPAGGMFVLEASSLEEAEGIAEKDPYVAAGLFALTSVRPWRWQTKNVA